MQEQSALNKMTTRFGARPDAGGLRLDACLSERVGLKLAVSTRAAPKTKDAGVGPRHTGSLGGRGWPPTIGLPSDLAASLLPVISSTGCPRRCPRCWHKMYGEVSADAHSSPYRGCSCVSHTSKRFDSACHIEVYGQNLRARALDCFGDSLNPHSTSDEPIGCLRPPH